MKKFILPLVAAVFLTAFTFSPSPTATGSVSGEDQSLNGGRTLTAVLLGANEVPNPGDPDGSGYAEITLNQGQGTISYMITVTDIAPATAAHIHFAPAGVPGGVVVALSAPTGGFSSGIIQNVNRDLIKAIRQNPDAYYVNVHNGAYPGGALRGQLSK